MPQSFGCTDSHMTHSIWNIVLVGGGSVLIASSFCYHHLSSRAPLTMKMSPAVSFYTLSDQLLAFIKQFHFEYRISITIFQDDNIRIHMAPYLLDWFQEHSSSISHLSWLNESPKRNPIGNIWEYLEHWVRILSRPFLQFDCLAYSAHERVASTWWGIPTEPLCLPSSTNPGCYKRQTWSNMYMSPGGDLCFIRRLYLTIV